MPWIDLPVCIFEQRDKVVKAKIVDVAPHLAHIMTFAVHRQKFLLDDCWRVSNVETGFCVKHELDGETMDEAITNCRKYLSDVTPAMASKSMRKAAKQGAI